MVGRRLRGGAGRPRPAGTRFEPVPYWSKSAGVSEAVARDILNATLRVRRCIAAGRLRTPVNARSS
jgi:hypothetical protein